MNQKIPDRPILPEEVMFFPLNFYREMMKQMPESLYRATFSFASYIQSLKEQVGDNQDHILWDNIELLEKFEQRLANEKVINWAELAEHPDFAILYQSIFPSFFYKNQLGMIMTPFDKREFSFQTEEFASLIDSDEWEVKFEADDVRHSEMHDVLIAGTAILNEFYGEEIDIHLSEGMALRNRETGLEKHLRFNIVLDYIDIELVKPLKKLTKRQIQELLNNLDDKALWEKYLPPERFHFKGFLIGFLSDVTQSEIQSVMRELIVKEEGAEEDLQEGLQAIQGLFRSYLNFPDLEMGSVKLKANSWVDSAGWTLIRQMDRSLFDASLVDPTSLYRKVVEEGEAVIVGDLSRQKQRAPIEEALYQKGLRSLMLVPMRDKEGKIFGVFELGGPRTFMFNQLTLLQLKDMIGLYVQGTLRFLRATDEAVQLTMQQEFTSIHPSVEWRFREVASKFYWQQVVERKQGHLDPIVFKQVYPIYGQADIVGSSRLRNESIAADMLDNLERLQTLIRQTREVLAFDLLDVYFEKVESFRSRLADGAFVSSDESLIVELLTREIHPLLRSLYDQHTEMSKEAYQDYIDYLDPQLNIVYRRRKAYEESVSLLNQTISYFLSQEEERMQEIMPHFFEKYETDGVEYNLYLGQSILENGTFNDFYLKDFRLWQLLMMCELTRLIEQEAKQFPVTLRTAQLIFVYNNALSIRFHMDEKQFDVDGAYNVRYEILKKRIDKAYIKGTNERLTQAGKIAIVWLQDKDRQEYQTYLDHMVNRGLIKPEIEDLELDRMQGVEGLRAIRVEVIL